MHIGEMAYTLHDTPRRRLYRSLTMLPMCTPITLVVSIGSSTNSTPISPH
jgi:hypothetical protein